MIVRIVSLLPSATEIVYGLGLGSQLAGVTFECDEPASPRTEKTVVVGGRDTAAMTPAAIDAYVRAVLRGPHDREDFSLRVKNSCSAHQKSSR